VLLVDFNTVRHASLNTICSELLNDALTEYVYDAELAGLYYSLDNTMYGLKVLSYSNKDIMCFVTKQYLHGFGKQCTELL